MAPTPRHCLGLLAGAWALLLGAFAVQTAAQDSGAGVIEGAFKLREGVVVDPKRKLMFLMSPKQAIDAVALDSGRVVWSSDAASKPLIVGNDQLVGQVEPTGAPVLELALLDPESGKEEATAKVDLPKEVKVYVGMGPVGIFRSDGYVAGAQEVIVGWKFVRLSHRGAGPRPTDLGPPVQGAVSVTLPEGKVQQVDAATVEKRGLRNSSSSVANRLDSPTPFAEGVSSDGRYLVRGRRVKDEKEAYYLWQVIDRNTEKTVAEFHNPSAIFAPFFIREGVLYYETKPSIGQRATDDVVLPLHIRAVELSTGKEIWTRPFRDTSQRGPLPP
jgi:hypothetical protein